MLDKNKHKITLIHILKDIYADPSLRHVLGFKGGTAIFIFYNLPRFSVDLDFNLLDETKKDIVFKKVQSLLTTYGELIDAVEKRNTIFFLLSYQKGDRQIKVEISKRPSVSSFEVKHYLGIPISVMKKEDIAAEKLSALLTRKKFASRDLFDLWFLLKNQWTINEAVVKEKTGNTLQQSLKETIERVQSIHKNQLLQGLGELLDEKHKQFVREKLIAELTFMLSLYLQEHVNSPTITR